MDSRTPNPQRPASDIFAAALDQTQAIVQDLDGIILRWTKGAEALYGWTAAEALGRVSHEMLDTTLPVPLNHIRSILLTAGSWSGEFRQRRRDGSRIWVVGHWTLLRDGHGTPVAVIKMNNNITALKESEATARSFFNNVTHGILTAGADGLIVDANHIALSLFGYTHNELVGSPVEILLPESLREGHVTHRAAYTLHPHARPMGQGMDLIARRKDGSVFPVEVSLNFASNENGGLVIAFITDITARKKAQKEREDLIARLEWALAEKTVLLKEVHHRVKNNMAVISGLLGLQADTLQDTHAAEALAASQRRVESMALIHEYLYSTDHLDRINFGKYIEQLTSEVWGAYALNPDRVAVKIDAADIDLGIHRAIPCGLILNELFSNALKYAFPAGRSGTIRVYFGTDESGDLVLTVEDDGVGLPANFDWENAESVGLRIVRILARQIDAHVTLTRGAVGTNFTMRFPPHAPAGMAPGPRTASPSSSQSKVESWSEPGGSDPSRSSLRSASASRSL